VKVIVLARANEQVDVAEFRSWLCGSAARELAQSLGSPGCIVNVADQPSPWSASGDTAAHSYDAVVEVWTDVVDAASAVRKQLGSHCRSVHIYQVDETVWKRPERPDRFNLVAVWNAPPGQGTFETQRHWREHAPLAVAIHHGATGYVQNWLAKPLSTDAPPHAGIAMLRFPSLAAIRDGLFRSEGDKATIANDVADFVADNHVLYTTEYIISAGLP